MLGLFTKTYCEFSYIFFMIHSTNPVYLIVLLIFDDE